MQVDWRVPSCHVEGTSYRYGRSYWFSYIDYVYVWVQVLSTLCFRYVSPQRGMVDVALNMWAVSPRDICLPGYSRYNDRKGTHERSAALYARRQIKVIVDVMTCHRL